LFLWPWEFLIPEIRYHPGDAIALKPRIWGALQPGGRGQVVSVLPETQGSVRYRVRLHGECFDRSISQEDIDNTASSAPMPDEKEAPSSDTGWRWINSDTIRTRK